VIRELHSHAEMRALSDLFAAIWGWPDEKVIPKEIFVAAALSGNQVHSAFDGEAMVGGSWGFLNWDGSEFSLHSHITGVLPSHEGTGLGLALKHAQRDWCLTRNIERVTWTFDPMVARNAAFNLRKLGARGVAFLPDFYGPMHDRFNAGRPSDRIEIVWYLRGAPPAGPEALTVAVTDRDTTTKELAAAFERGLIATGFERDRGYVFSEA
jgi:predicted GNAT superfamily acetyltransferase